MRVAILHVGVVLLGLTACDAADPLATTTPKYKNSYRDNRGRWHMPNGDAVTAAQLASPGVLDQLRAGEYINKDPGAWHGSLAREDTAAGVVLALAGLRERMCTCGNTVCADHVQADYVAYGEAVSKSETLTKPDQATIDKATQIVAEYAKCEARARAK